MYYHNLDYDSCLYQAISGKVEEKIELTIIQEQLIPQFELSNELFTVLASGREGSNIHQNEALKLLMQLLEIVDEQLLSRLLP